MSVTTLGALGLGKSRKVKHRKLTAERWAVLEQQADLLVQLYTHQELADQLGVTRSYVAQALSRLVAERRGRAPRLTHGFALNESTRETNCGHGGEMNERTGRICSSE